MFVYLTMTFHPHSVHSPIYQFTNLPVCLFCHSAESCNSLSLNSAIFHPNPLASACQVSKNDDLYQDSTNTFLQTFPLSSLQQSLSAPSSTTQPRLRSLHPSSVTPITVPRPQTPRRSSSNPRRLPAPPLPGVHPSSEALFSLTVSAP